MVAYIRLGLFAINWFENEKNKQISLFSVIPNLINLLEINGLERCLEYTLKICIFITIKIQKNGIGYKKNAAFYSRLFQCPQSLYRGLLTLNACGVRERKLFHESLP
jgi:hypothetical protein